MPPTPETEGHPDPMTITEIAMMVGRSRQLIHRLAANDPAFPAPVVGSGTTRPRYPRQAVIDYWTTRTSQLRQGRRTDLEAQQAAEPATAEEGATDAP